MPENETIETLAEEQKAEPVYARYLGEGVRYLVGIPARDLTRGEWVALGEAEQKRALGVKPAVYEIVAERTAKKPR